ncbi:MAG: hypothetical protein ACOX6T_18390 [Myxococcales bacterium]|jgi:hypothetical protein
MRLRVALILATLLALSSTGCALFGGRSCESAYRFPERFDLIQVITVEQGGQRHQFLASVRRAGADFDFVLLDPVIQRPLVEAAYRAGEWTERSNLPKDVDFKARELFDAIRQLFAAQCFPKADGNLEFRSDRLRFWFAEPAPGECSMPATIKMKPRMGDAIAVTAETQDVGCEEPTARRAVRVFRVAVRPPGFGRPSRSAPAPALTERAPPPRRVFGSGRR